MYCVLLFQISVFVFRVDKVDWNFSIKWQVLNQKILHVLKHFGYQYPKCVQANNSQHVPKCCIFLLFLLNQKQFEPKKARCRESNYICYTLLKKKFFFLCLKSLSLHNTDPSSMGQFHQRSMSSFTHADPESAKSCLTWQSFLHFWDLCV